MISNAKKYARLRDEQYALFENYAKKHGLNSKSLLVFMWIYHNSYGMTQESIAKRTFSTKQVIQAIVKTYIKKDILYLEPSKKDGRKKIVRLTEKGEKFAAELLEPLSNFEAQAMAALSKEQQEVLLSATAMFTENLRGLLENHQVEKDD
ncbi:MarR family winged helix-turn-helix transcriptional regulator [Streptococcus equinus]|uniref:MarR family winged helix-turn-helix transcriptional regulator n=1 Tax=Streptococcus equinus TaxID=1335 RepID=UPI002EB27414|nr:MarR family transcriptional regulator [Streptococcus equinus]